MTDITDRIKRYNWPIPGREAANEILRLRNIIHELKLENHNLRYENGRIDIDRFLRKICDECLEVKRLNLEILKHMDNMNVFANKIDRSVKFKDVSNIEVKDVINDANLGSQGNYVIDRSAKVQKLHHDLAHIALRLTSTSEYSRF